MPTFSSGALVRRRKAFARKAGKFDSSADNCSHISDTIVVLRFVQDHGPTTIARVQLNA